MDKWLNSIMLVGLATCLAAMLTGVTYYFGFISLSVEEKRAIFTIYCIGAAAVMIPAFCKIFLRNNNV